MWFDFLYKLVRKISHSEEKWARYDKKCTLVFMWSTRYSCPILIKLEFSWHIFEKSSNIEFLEVLPIGSRDIPYGRTDMTNLIVSFGNFANAPKNSIWNAYITYNKPDTHTWGRKNNHRHTECWYEVYDVYIFHYSCHFFLKIYFPTCTPVSTVDIKSRPY